MKQAAALLALAVLTGCASTNKDYVALLTAQQAVAVQNAEAAKARYQAMAQIASSGDAASRTAAVMAMAMVQIPHVQLPAPPENEAYKWASILLPAISNLGTGYFGYRLGTTQSDNAAATTIAGYNTFGQMATAGYASLGSTASAGFTANSNIAGLIQAPQPNITLSGQGVIGSGSYAYSAPVTTTTTTTTNTTTTSNSNNTNRACNGGNGGGTTTGAAGGAASC